MATLHTPAICLDCRLSLHFHCPECEGVFDAEEWYFGHDCEA